MSSARDARPIVMFRMGKPPLLGRIHRPACSLHFQKQQPAKRRPPRQRFKFDYASMVANDFRDQCKSEASAGRLGRHKGVEGVAGSVRWNPRAVIANADL